MFGKWLLASVVLGSVVAVGCGQGQSSSGSGAAPAKGASTSDAAIAVVAETPTAAVSQFLEFARKGNDAGAASLLTAVARQKTAQYQMSIQPPCSKQAQVKIEQEQLMEDDKGCAQVGCKVTDKDDDGTVSNEMLVWLVKKEPAGWRVSGMASKVFPDQPPLILNFEDPEDMTRKQQMVEQEMQRRAAAEAKQSTAAAPGANQGAQQTAQPATQPATQQVAQPRENILRQGEQQPAQQQLQQATQVLPTDPAVR